MVRNDLLFSALLVVVPSVALFFDLLIAVVVFIAMSVLLVYSKRLTKSGMILPVVLFLIVLYSFAFFFVPSVQIARYSGPIMNDNWWQALTWLKENTAEDAVVATYWDFGHFITAVARRPVVFDGASQSDLYTRPASPAYAGKSGLVVEPHDHSIERIMMFNDGNVTTARIKDIATVLLTDNESLAIDILKDYRTGGGDMYFIASADLLGKSFWWTYFSTWSPTETKGCPGSFNHGDCYSYSIVSLSNTRPLAEEGAVSYNYLSGNQGFVLIDRSGTLEAYVLQSGQLASIQKLFVINPDGTGTLRTQPTAPVQGLLWIEPSRQTAIYIAPELENSIFTSLFLFNGRTIEGEPLEHFRLVGSWGGEVKIYKVIFPE